MKRYLILFLCSLLFCSTISAQIQKADSLERLLKRHIPADTVKVNLLNQLAYTIYSRDPKQARAYADQSGKLADRLHYLKGKAFSLRITGLALKGEDRKLSLDLFRKALSLAEKIDDKVEICKCLIAIGRISSDLGDIKRCDEAYERALRLAREINEKGLITQILYNISQRLTSDADYQGAIKLLQETIAIAEERGDKKWVTNSYGQLGFIHVRLGNFPVALDYYLSALKVNEQIDNTSGIFYNLLNISSIQVEQKNYDGAFKTAQKAFLQAKKRGDLRQMTAALTCLGSYCIKSDPKMAMSYYQKALATIKDNNIRYRIDILTRIGSLYTDQSKFDEALKCFEEALGLAQGINLKRSLGMLWRELGTLYFEQKQYQRSLNYTQQALQIAQEKNLLELQKDSYKQLSEIYAATGAFQLAYQSQVQFKLLSDSLFNEESVRETTILQSNYKYDKEKQVYEMEKAAHNMKIQGQRQIILFLVIVSVLVLLLAFTIYWTNRLKKKVLNLQLESVHHELEINQKAMAAAKLKLVQNAERDAYSIKMLENLKKDIVGEGQNDIRSLIAGYKLKSYDSNWNEFELLFEKVNGAFYETLNERYPTLTPNERKLCVFLKLNMSNNHISQVTFQSEEALKKARLRLRKKLEIDRDTNLAAFIQSL